MLYGSRILLLFYLELILRMVNKGVYKCQCDKGCVAVELHCVNLAKLELHFSKILFPLSFWVWGEPDFLNENWKRVVGQ